MFGQSHSEELVYIWCGVRFHSALTHFHIRWSLVFWYNIITYLYYNTKWWYKTKNAYDEDLNDLFPGCGGTALVMKELRPLQRLWGTTHVSLTSGERPAVYPVPETVNTLWLEVIVHFCALVFQLTASRQRAGSSWQMLWWRTVCWGYYGEPTADSELSDSAVAAHEARCESCVCVAGWCRTSWAMMQRLIWLSWWKPTLVWVTYGTANTLSHPQTHTWCHLMDVVHVMTKR